MGHRVIFYLKLGIHQPSLNIMVSIVEAIHLREPMLELEEIWPEIIGFSGAILFLISYALLQTGKMKADSFSYSFVNLLAASMILISLMYSWNFPAVFIETAWIIVSAYGILKCFTRAKRQKTKLPQ